MRIASSLALLVLSGCFVSDSTIEARTDADGDGFFNTASGGDDCDDSNPAINPGVAEVFYDDIDNDCSGLENDDDLDGDGAPIGADCDDTDPAFGPDAEDVWYDGIDHDCAGNDDYDQDGDGVRRPVDAEPGEPTDCNDNDPAVFGPEVTCDGIDNDCNVTTPDRTDVDNDNDQFDQCSDCNDNDALVFPGAAERCNSLDDDCDGHIDNGLVFYDVFEDGDNDGHGTPDTPETPSLNVCGTPPGYVESDDDCDDDQATVSPSVLELCDGLDNDCDSMPDDGLTVSLYFPDLDGDGFANDSDSSTGVQSCVVLDGFSAVGGDCNDAPDEVGASQFPGNDETCDTLDNDCDGNVDNGLFLDADADSFGDPVVVDCLVAVDAGIALVRNSEDCDDTRDDLRPDIPDVCDGLDNDCDGTIDNDFALGVFYADADGDGIGDDATAEDLCAPRPGMVAVAGDCDDSDPTVRPFQAEICDGLDNNCDGNVDEGLDVLAWFLDADEDGSGAPTTGMMSCVALPGRVTNDFDCDDTNSAVRPGQTETCDDVDNNCDGNVDEGLELSNWFFDQDEDGYGDPMDVLQSCRPVENRVQQADDCDDTNPAVYMGNTEVCDGFDNDCSGEPDDGPVMFIDYFVDQDADGFGGDNDIVNACSPPLGRVTVGGDCDDTNAAVKPGQNEICNDLDDDCDGEPDDGILFVDYYADLDRDGAGDPLSMPEMSCAVIAGAADNDDDCDDTNPLRSPTLDEVCDGIDNDCDLVNDNGLDPDPYWPDADGDGFGDDGAPTHSCIPLANHVTNDGDCDDTRSDINPGATEFCADMLDTDCDEEASVLEAGAIGLSPVYVDDDADGHGVPWANPADQEFACDIVPTQRSFLSDDCDDTNFQNWRTGLQSLGFQPSREQIQAAMDESCEGSIVTFDGTVIMDEPLRFGIAFAPQIGVTLRGGEGAAFQLDVPDGEGPLPMIEILKSHDVTIENIAFNGCPEPEDTCNLGRFLTQDRDLTLDVGRVRTTFRDVTWQNFKAPNEVGFSVDAVTVDLQFFDVSFSNIETTDDIPFADNRRRFADGLILFTRGTHASTDDAWSQRPGDPNGLVESRLTIQGATISQVYGHEPTRSALISDTSAPFRDTQDVTNDRPFNVILEDIVVNDTNAAFLRMVDTRFSDRPDEASTMVSNVLVVNSSADYVIDTEGPQPVAGSGQELDWVARPDRTLTIDGLTILNSTGGGVRGHDSTTLTNSVMLTPNGEAGTFASATNCLSDDPSLICVQSPAAADLFVDPTLVDGLPVDITVDPTNLPAGVSLPIGYLP